MAVTADAQTLLGSYPWHAKVKRDLEQGPSTVDVMALLKDGFDGIVLMEHRRSERHFATCKPALRVISRALDRLEMPKGATPMLFASAPPEGDEWDLSPVALPDTETVEALNEAIDRGDAVRYLITNARQGHRALTPVAGTHPTEVRSDYPSQPTIAHGYTKAIVGAWFDGGPSAAMLAISQAIDSGPTTATATLVGMLNLVGQKLNEVDLLMGPTVAQQVAFIAEPDGPTSKGSSSPAGDPRH